MAEHERCHGGSIMNDASHTADLRAKRTVQPNELAGRATDRTSEWSSAQLVDFTVILLSVFFLSRYDYSDHVHECYARLRVRF